MVTYLIIVGREGQFGGPGNGDGRLGEKGQEREDRDEVGILGLGLGFLEFSRVGISISKLSDRGVKSNVMQ